MNMKAGFALIVLGLAVSAACAPGSTRVGSGASQPGEAQKPSRVVIANWGEVKNLSDKLDRGSTYGGDYAAVVNSPLTIVDAQGQIQPRLASELPSQEGGSWTVNPDGTMATTWKLRPNALWHDGRPVIAQDVEFAFRVYMDPDVVTAGGEPERFIDRVEVLDEKTFVIRYKQTYPWASRLGTNALPRHILEAPYQTGDKVAFQNSPFWSSNAYVSNGAYRIAEWTIGSQLIFRAFDQFFLGRPKIDEVVFQVTPDANTVVAYVLSGTVDVTVNTTMNQAAWLVVKQEWDRANGGEIYAIPKYLRATQFQLDPNRLRQTAFLDLRVRRALVHSLDRVAIAEAVSQGASPLAHTMMSPGDPLYPQLARSMATYPYDTARALALFQEAGWTRRGEALVDAAGRPLTAEIMTTEMADNVTEMRIMADYFKQIGVEIAQTPVPEALNRDAEFRATFGSFTITGQGIDLPRSLNSYAYEACPTSERRFSGGNRGCWNHPEFDHFYRVATTSLVETERADATVQALRVITEEVPIIPMSYNLDNVAVRKGLKGPGPRQPQTKDTWNIHEWTWD